VRGILLSKCPTNGSIRESERELLKRRRVDSIFIYAQSRLTLGEDQGEEGRHYTKGEAGATEVQEFFQSTRNECVEIVLDLVNGNDCFSRSDVDRSSRPSLQGSSQRFSCCFSSLSSVILYPCRLPCLIGVFSAYERFWFLHPFPEADLRSTTLLVHLLIFSDDYLVQSEKHVVRRSNPLQHFG
jgi:hypothetical protein